MARWRLGVCGHCPVTRVPCVLCWVGPDPVGALSAQGDVPGTVSLVRCNWSSICFKETVEITCN